MRSEGARAEGRLDRFRSELDADPRVARAFAELDTTRLTPEERRLVARTLRDYRRAGADLDEAARERLRSLFETLERLSVDSRTTCSRGA